MKHEGAARQAREIPLINRGPLFKCHSKKCAYQKCSECGLNQFFRKANLCDIERNLDIEVTVRKYENVFGRSRGMQMANSYWITLFIVLLWLYHMSGAWCGMHMQGLHDRAHTFGNNKSRLHNIYRSLHRAFSDIYSNQKTFSVVAASTVLDQLDHGGSDGCIYF